MMYGFLNEIDSVCGQLATGMHNFEFQIYATLALIAVLSALLFPTRNDPDQA